MMMYSSQLDGNSALSGGGLRFSQSTQAFDSTPPPSSNRETRGIVPVTVKQISEASHSGDDKSNFVICGVDVANVSLVGLVFTKAERVTDVAFTLDDGTGKIDCNRWLNEEFDKREVEDIQDGVYVRVNGRLRGVRGKGELVAFSIRPVTNFDEIPFHFIECIHFHLKHSRVQLQGDALPHSGIVNSSPIMTVQNGSTGYKTAPPSQISAHFGIDGLKGCDDMVLNYLQLPANFGREKGVHTDELSQKLKLPIGKIMESIRTLEDEGLIYSTIDEFHYKSTTCS